MCSDEEMGIAEPIDCPECMGTGGLDYSDCVPPGHTGPTYDRCETCKGTGELSPEELKQWIREENEEVDDDIRSNGPRKY